MNFKFINLAITSQLRNVKILVIAERATHRLEILILIFIRVRYFNGKQQSIDYGHMSRKCKKEISNPQMDFHIGQEDNGNQFHYAVCSCPGCKVCLGIMSVQSGRRKIRGQNIERCARISHILSSVQLLERRNHINCKIQRTCLPTM